MSVLVEARAFELQTLLGAVGGKISSSVGSSIDEFREVFPLCGRSCRSRRNGTSDIAISHEDVEYTF
jgi:hypothetical protein